MQDLFFIVITVLFFVVAALLARGCEQLEETSDV